MIIKRLAYFSSHFCGEANQADYWIAELTYFIFISVNCFELDYVLPFETLILYNFFFPSLFAN